LPPELAVGAEYGLMVSRKAAPDAAGFAIYLLSPQGQSSLQSFGFISGRIADAAALIVPTGRRYSPFANAAKASA
jgi:hypothetical protein